MNENKIINWLPIVGVIAFLIIIALGIFGIVSVTSKAKTIGLQKGIYYSEIEIYSLNAKIMELEWNNDYLITKIEKLNAINDTLKQSVTYYADKVIESQAKLNDIYTTGEYEGTINGLLEFMLKAKASHQYYIDNPEKQTLQTGDTEHNLNTIKYYDQIIDLINNMEEN